MRDQPEFVQLIDRYRLGDARRLVLGLSPGRDFSSVNAALLLARGRGKCLRPLWVEHRQYRMAKPVVDACRRWLTGDASRLDELSQLRCDFSGQLALSAQQVLAISQSSERKLLAVCVDDPGIWVRDFDGALCWEPMVSAATLAETLGFCVIDGFPIRDMSGGGRGWPVEPLAWWLLFADRNRRVANSVRVLVDWSADCRIGLIPPSDGVDDQLPELKHLLLPGRDLETAMLAPAGLQEISAIDRSRLGAQGTVSEELARFLEQSVVEFRAAAHPSANAERLVHNGLATRFVQDSRIPVSDALKTLAVVCARAIAQFVGSEFPESSSASCQLVGGGWMDENGLLGSELGRHLNAEWMETRDFNYSSVGLNPVSVAMMGLMHIDQMPLSVPELTGCAVPRVAGRLTPGSLSHFRRLIMEMADTNPPTMKLREAV
jgi:1,6-anhydro-N-acetylmuramate kinase